MACAEVKMDYAESGFKIKLEPGIIPESSGIDMGMYKCPQPEGSQIQTRMPSLATLLTSTPQPVSEACPSPEPAPLQDTQIRASTLAEMLTQNRIGSVKQTNSGSASVGNDKSSELSANERRAPELPGASNGLRALLTSQGSQGSPENTHTYTTRKKTGAYEKVRRPAKYLSEDLVDSDVLYETSKKSYVPLNIPVPRPRSVDITTVRNSTATLPKLSYIGLENVQRNNTGSCLPVMKTESSTHGTWEPIHSGLQSNFAADSPRENTTTQRPTKAPVPHQADPDFVSKTDNILHSLLIPHEYNTRTKSGTCKPKEDVYQAFKLSTFEDEQSSYSNSVCSEVEGESGNESPVSKRRRKQTPRKTMVFDKDPKVYPPEPPTLMELICGNSAVTELDYSRNSPGPVQNSTVVPNTCSCKFDSPTKKLDSDNVKSSHVLAMLLTGNEIVENDLSRCTCGKGTTKTLKAEQSPREKETRSPLRDATENSSERSEIKSNENPLVASTLLCQIAKAVQQTSERTYVPKETGKKKSPEKQYTNFKEAESKESSVLRLLLTSRNEEEEKTPVRKRQRRQRRFPLPSYEERSGSSSPEPSALHSLLTSREPQSKPRHSHCTRKQSHTVVHPSQLVGANSVYIDNAEKEESPYGKMQYGNPLVIEPSSTEATQDLPILNSLLSIRRRKSIPTQTNQIPSHSSHPFSTGTQVKSEAMDYTDLHTPGFEVDYASHVKQEPQDEAFDLRLSGRVQYGVENSAYPSGQWENTPNKGFICIQPEKGENERQDSPSINPSDEYIDMEDLGKAEMPGLQISSVESLSTQSRAFTDEQKSSPPPLHTASGTVCTICGSVFKSVLLLSMHKDKVHSQNQAKTKGRKSLNSIINSCYANQRDVDSGVTPFRVLGSLVELPSRDSPSSDSSSASDLKQSKEDMSYLTAEPTAAFKMSTITETATEGRLVTNPKDLEAQCSGSQGSPMSSIAESSRGEQENRVAERRADLDKMFNLAGSTNDSLPNSPASRTSQNHHTALLPNCDGIEQPSHSVSDDGSALHTKPSLNIRSIIRPSHMCGVCQEEFDTRAALLSHQLVHRQGKYVCESCQDAFSLHEAFVKHKMKCQPQ